MLPCASRGPRASTAYAISRASSRPRAVAGPWSLRSPASRRSRSATPACKVSCTCLALPAVGHALLHLSGEMRHETDHALKQHELTAVVHLVLLWRQKHLERVWLFFVERFFAYL